MFIKKWMVDLTPSFLIKLFARPYVAGDSAAKAAEVAKHLWDSRKVRSTADLLGEDLVRDEDSQVTIAAYQKLIDTLGAQEHSSISLKPTQFAVGMEKGPYVERIGGIIRAAEKFGIPVTIDMEDHNYTDLTLDIYKELKAEFPSLGTVLQSRLFRTTNDIAGLKGLNARVRICIGIYIEPATVALTTKPEIKEKFLEHVEMLLTDGHYTEIATHDEKILRRALAIAERINPAHDRFEVQMLLGVPRRDIQDELIARGIKVRLYVPYAEQWKDAIHYCKRRMIANPSMGLLVARTLIPRRKHPLYSKK